MIPQCNPRANYLSHKAEIDASIDNVLESGRYILGKEVSSFEQMFAEYIGVDHAIGVASGTDALELALRACGIGIGDFVVTVSHTAVATVTAIVRAGASPLYVDINPENFTMDPNHLEALLKSQIKIKPKAIIPVHLYGQPADMSAIKAISDQYGLFVIEDCSQAHGAVLNGRKVGTWGDIACFSLYPTKNLGAIGDGGIIVTSDSRIAGQLVLLREYGWHTRFLSEIHGMNSRLDELQAAVLQVKLKYLDVENSRRREIAQIYSRLLTATDFIIPKTSIDTSHVYHQYVIKCDERDVIMAKLKNNGIGTAIHYPIPIHNQLAYSNKIFKPHPLINTENIVSRILSLPIYPEMTDDELEIVVQALLI